MVNRILIALQYWEGDKARALELAKFIADLEPVKCQLADFLFAARFDSKIDDPTVRHVARKFNVYTRISRRRGTGWPDGCNELWFSVMEWAQSMILSKKIPHYKAIFTCEADGAPIQRDWIARLSSEWDRVNKEKHVAVAGALVEPGPHINGNALITGNLNFLNWIARRVGGVRPGGGWDYVLRSDFQRIGWADIPGIKSIYNTPTFSQQQYEDMIKKDWTWIHGVKDTSLIHMGRERFKV
jgi:hypothetical protein